MNIVVDASALVEYVLRSELGDRVASMISRSDRDLHVPALCDVEVAAALRRALLSRLLDNTRAAEAVEDYLDLPLTKHGHETLIPRVLALRDNLSAYDATYVALAERLRAGFLTGDHGLASSAKTHTDLPILTP